MIKKAIVFIATAALLILLMTSCAAQSDSAAASAAQAEVAVISSEPTQATVTETAVETTTVTNVNLDTDVMSVAEAAGENSTNLQDVEDYSATSSDDLVADSSTATEITLDGDSISVAGDGVTVDGRTATITSTGTYTLSGSLAEGQIVVDTDDEETVQLVFNGIEITNSSTAPIFIANAALTEIVLPANSQNYVTDGAAYVFANPEEDEPNAAIFSKDELVIYGAGSLTVDANYNDGIASKDGLVIAGGNLVVDAVDDGIRGKDYLIVTDGSIIVTAQGDGLKSDEDADPTMGYISIEGGRIDITSGGDAIQAATDVLISAGEFAITSGGGSSSYVDAESSAKGIKGAVNVIIDGGSFTINSADDAIHSNDNITVNGGTFTIATGDDGLHADATLELNGGLIDISASYEGIESAVITINDGEFYIVSSDDGINVAGGNDGSGFGPGGGPGGRPRGGGPGQDVFTEYTGNYYLYINGGYTVVTARGDGIDVNGAIEMTDGVVIVNGPTEQMNGALDYDGTFTISGGFMVAAGSAGMAQTADASSTQNALLMNFDGTLPANTLIHIEDSNGNSILAFAPAVNYQSIAFSSPELSTGVTYTVYYGGSASGTGDNGLYVDGTYTPGTELGSFTVSSTVTMIGNTGRRF